VSVVADAGSDDAARTAERLRLRRRIGEALLPRLAYLARAYRMTLARRVRVVVVVGSAGKTTTMRAVSAALDRPVSRPALLNMNSHASLGRALIGVRPWQRHAVFEVAINRPGQMAVQAATVRPNVVVVTSIGHDHWRSFGTLEATRQEKAAMVRRLGRRDIAVLNADDPNVRWMASQTRARVVLVGEADDAEVRASDIAVDWPHGMRFRVHAGGEVRDVRTRLLGRQMVFPALGAVAVAYLERRPLDAAIARVEALPPTPGRMQMLVLDNGAVVIRDDFKGTTDAGRAALDALAQLPAHRRMVVMGDIEEVGGKEDYRTIGRHAATVADRVIIVGTTTVAQLYRVGLRAGGLARERIAHVRHPADATELLRDELRDGDVVLLRGRWQQALGRIGLALSGTEVRCRAYPCPFKRQLCDVCPMLAQPFNGLPAAND
jgi:UDP-N-acetylmuramoyl-tripeptide--D-alanyl-D-alanine ligase